MSNELQPPALEIIGAYSLTADADACRRFIIDEINKQASLVVTDEQKATLRRIGRVDALEPYTAEQKDELAGDLYDHMADSTMFEVLVTILIQTLTSGHSFNQFLLNPKPFGRLPGMGDF